MSLLDPVVRLVGTMSFRHKMRATALVFGVPLLVALAVILAGLGARVAAVGKERDALAVQLPALTLLATTHQYLATSAAWRAGAEPLAEQLQARRASTDDAVRALAAVLAERQLRPATSGGAGDWLDAWKARLDEVGAGDEERLAELHSELRTTLRGELERLNDGAGLLVDGETASSRLLDIVSAQLPELIDTAGQAARLGAVVLVQQRVKSSRRTELTLLRGNFNALVQWSMDGMQKVVREHPELAVSLDAAASRLNTAFLGVQEAMTTKMLDTSDFDLAPDAYLALTAAAFDQALSVGASVVSDTDRLLAARESALRTQRNGVVGAMLLILALVVAAFVAAYISIMRGLNGLSAAVETMASGDLSARVEVTSSDEIGAVGAQFNRMVESLAQRTALLREKTTAIQNLLHHLPQGVLTIVGGGTIHAEYSDFLATIFETRDVSGRAAIDFLFADSDVGADTLAQIEATIFASLGEPRINFDFNAHLLAGALVRTMADGRVKHLELNWSPICNDDGSVDKIMVCVRDVSELRVLEAQAEQQQRELQLIGQILAVDADKFDAFVASARAFVAHNAALLNAAAEPQSQSGADAELIAQLFRNMHTVKGNARTYGLLQLTHVVHDAEQAYDELRRGARFDKPALLAQLERVIDAIDEYAALNELKLGRHGAGSAGAADGLAADREALAALYGELAALDLRRASPGELAAAVRRSRQVLRELGSAPIEALLAGVFDALPSLAAELDKEPPKLRVNDHGVRLRHQLGEPLRNVFMHLCRNSIDHGIESVAERFEQGKHPAGTICVDLALVGERLQLRLADDGRGLALDVIRRQARERGLIAEGGDWSDEAVAELIFAAGFSTASRVSEVSGRGVGMDAVRAFVERAGGEIALVFTGESDGAGYRPFATQISLPARYALPAPPADEAPSDDAPRHVDGRDTGTLGELRALVAGISGIGGIGGIAGQTALAAG